MMRKSLSVFILISCTVYVIALFYFRPLLGDDVPYQFQNGINYWMDDAVMSHELIKTLPESLANSHYYYMNWTGRFYHNTFQSFVSVFGKGIISVFAGAIFALFIMSVSALAFSDWKKAFEHPLSMLAFYIIFVFFHFAVRYNIMWIMIVTYTLPVTLFLIYLYLLDGELPKSLHYVIMFNVLGFSCGIGHEMLGVVLAFMLLGKCITIVFFQKKMLFWNYIKLQIGFVIGYCICFFAPGNFRRTNASVNQEGFGRSYFERLFEGIDKNISALYPSQFLDSIGFTKTIYIAFVAFMILVCAVFIIRNKQLKIFIFENLFLLFGLTVSPFLWALAPHIGSWTTGLWGAIFYILLIRIVISAQIKKLPELIYKRHLNIFVCIVLFLFLIIQNFGWYSSFIRIGVTWNKAIKYAKEAGEEEVYVPKFPEHTILFSNEINNPAYYERDIYIGYYGVKIVPE